MTIPSRLRMFASGLETALARPWLGLAILLVVWGSLIVWRAHLESSLWIDETYSLALVSHPPDRLIALTAADAHPPGYYLALKAWLKLARIAGFEPGVFWARLLGVAAWLGLAVTAWVGGRWLLGRNVGALTAWMVAGSAYAALHARDLRSYSFACLGIFVVFLGWVAIVQSREPGRVPWASWPALVFGSLLAVWAHLLAGVVLAVLAAVTVGWLVYSGRRAPWSRLVGAGILVLLGFLPWLLRVREQMDYLQGTDPTWMTPATFGNLVTVFTFWLPFGRIGSPGPPENASWLTWMGWSAILLPLGLVVWAVIAPRRRDEVSSGSLSPVAVVGLGSAVVFILTIWCLDRWEMAHVFHGPRYPSLVASLWGAGLAALVVWAARRIGRPTRVAVLSLLPLLACSVTGQWLLALRESSWGLVNWKRTAPAVFPAPGEPIYMLPPELGSFYRQSLDEYELRRIEDLPCGAQGADEVTILDLNPWPALDRPRDRLARYFLSRPEIAASIHRRSLPEGRDDVKVIHLTGPKEDRFGPLCPAGFVSRLARELPAAAALALPEDQGGPEWSWLEIDDDLLTGRWASRETVSVHFDRPVQAGDYLLHLVGERQPFPQSRAEIGLEVPAAGWSHRESVGAGGFHVTAPITVDETISGVFLKVEHPTWSPRLVGLSGDGRTLSFLLRAAWFERVR